MKKTCLAQGTPVIDTRASDFKAAFVLACRSPMIAVGEPPRHGPTDTGPKCWGPLSHAPLVHVAGVYRAAGAEIVNLSPATSQPASIATPASEEMTS